MRGVERREERVLGERENGEREKGERKKRAKRVDRRVRRRQV